MSIEGASIHSSAENRTARGLLSSALASVVLPEPGNPHTIINLDPEVDLSVKEIIPYQCAACASSFTPEKVRISSGPLPNKRRACYSRADVEIITRFNSPGRLS